MGCSPGPFRAKVEGDIRGLFISLAAIAQALLPVANVEVLAGGASAATATLGVLAHFVRSKASRHGHNHN